jgi:hypothetical protein
MGGKSSSNPDRFLARTQLEKMQSAAGVPVQFWHPRIERVKFKGGTFRGTKLSATGAKTWWVGTIKEPPRRRPFFVVSSNPTDSGALYLAHCTAKSFIETHGGRSAIVHVGAGNTFFPEYPKVVVIQNVLERISAERAELARDAVMRFPGTLRVLVLAGVTKPEQWVASKLGLYADFAINVGDMTKKDMVEE